MVKPRISIVRTPSHPDKEAVADAVRRAVELAGGLPPDIGAGKTVLLKPNLVCAPRTREGGAVTHPELCRAVAELVREKGGFPVIADSAGVGTDTESVIDFMGYGQLREDGFTVLDLKKTKSRRVINPHATVLPSMRVFEPALQADAIINLPVMKTHDQAEITISLKNLKGLLADSSKKEMHRKGLFRGIPEMALYFKPCFTVVDGIYTQEGVGPVYGDPVEMDLILAGRDMVALDTIAGLIIGYRPEEVATTVLAAELGLGRADPEEIEIAGLPWESVRRPFKRCSQSAIINESLPCRLEIGGDTCTGCRNTVIAVLTEMKEDNLLSRLAGKTIITGRPPGHAIAGNLVLVGNCAKPWRAKGRYIEGCPPENSMIIDILLEGLAR
ncbi:MAG: DUF362 domain-containing protein [Bacillota bacterium]